MPTSKDLEYYLAQSCNALKNAWTSLRLIGVVLSNVLLVNVRLNGIDVLLNISLQNLNCVSMGTSSLSTVMSSLSNIALANQDLF